MTRGQARQLRAEDRNISRSGAPLLSTRRWAHLQGGTGRAEPRGESRQRPHLQRRTLRASPGERPPTQRWSLA
jgi:hypothetical protein